MSLVKVQGNASGTGTLTIAAPNTNSNYTLTLPTNTGTLLTDSNSSQAGVFATLSVNSNNISADNSLGFRNRIINGAMMIDQRNAGGSVSATTGGQYFLDRWTCSISAGSKFTVQQSTTAPTGFKNSMLITSSTAWSVGASDYATVNTYIEGFNAADLEWGTANAKTITVSFSVRSSLTGTFAGVITNQTTSTAATRSYPFTFTISSANTFESKSVTIAGDTTGTWGSTNAGGISLTVSLAAGSSTTGTASAWAGAAYRGATGQTNLLATNSATFYITGVQLEVGSVATPFERRPYGTELQLCQRYYEKTLSQGTTSSSGQTSGTLIGIASSTTNIAAQWTFKQTKRATPTLTLSSFNGTSGSWANISNTDFAVTQPWGVGDNGFARLDSTGMTAGAAYWGFATASAEL